MKFLKKLTRTLLSVFSAPKTKTRRRKSKKKARTTRRTLLKSAVPTVKRKSASQRSATERRSKHAAIKKSKSSRNRSAALRQIPLSKKTKPVAEKMPKIIKSLPASKMKESASPGVLIGSVTHYFSQVHVAAIIVKKGIVRVGDTLYFKGHTTRFKHKVDSMQINRQPVEVAQKGDEIGIRVNKRVREHDEVYKISAGETL